MPKKKTPKDDCEDIKNDIHKLSRDIGALAKKAKKAYGELDDQTKKKVVGGIAALGALLLTRKTAKKVKKSRSAKKK